VVLEEKEPHLVDGGLDGIDLGYDVDAIGFLVDHSLDATDLSFDAIQSGKEGVTVLRVAWPQDS
jgi:hypothetical protein